MSHDVRHSADPARYDGTMPYRRSGRSGLKLPAISLGLWQNFGGADRFEDGRAVLRRAFDCGVTHFDLANNYGDCAGLADGEKYRLVEQVVAHPAVSVPCPA